MTLITRTARRRLVSLPALLLVLFGAATVFTMAPTPEAHAFDTIYRYWFQMNTCDVYLAGTDAKVEVKLDGSKQDSGWWEMNDLLRDDFERGSSETYSIASYYDLGTINGFWVKRNTWGANDGWCLSSIKLTQNAFDYDVGPRKFAWGKWVAAGAPIKLTSWTAG